MTKQRAVSETKTRGRASDALFLSGSLALDLANTEMVVRGKKRDVLSSPEALSYWWQEALVHHPERERVEEEESAINWTSELLEAVKRVRQTLRTVCIHLVEEQAGRDRRRFGGAQPGPFFAVRLVVFKSDRVANRRNAPDARENPTMMPSQLRA